MRFLMLMIFTIPLAATAMDYEDCLYRVEKLKKAARDADDTASSASGKDALNEIHSALEDVDSALSKAKKACEIGTSKNINYTEYCNRIANISRISGKNEAEKLCRTYQTGAVLNLCLSCAGVTNN